MDRVAQATPDIVEKIRDLTSGDGGLRSAKDTSGHALSELLQKAENKKDALLRWVFCQSRWLGGEGKFVILNGCSPNLHLNLYNHAGNSMLSSASFLYLIPSRKKSLSIIIYFLRHPDLLWNSCFLAIDRYFGNRENRRLIVLHWVVSMFIGLIVTNVSILNLANYFRVLRGDFLETFCQWAWHSNQ